MLEYDIVKKAPISRLNRRIFVGVQPAPKRLELNRRAFLGGAFAAAAVTASGRQTSYKANSLNIVEKAGNIELLSGRKVLWRFDKASYSECQDVTISTNDGVLSAELRGLRYAGTTLQLNYSCRFVLGTLGGLATVDISPSNSPTAKVQLKGSLEAWINGRSPLVGKFSRSDAEQFFRGPINGLVSIENIESGEVRLYVDGRLEFASPATVRVDSENYEVSGFSIIACKRTKDSLVSGRDKCQTSLSFEASQEWSNTFVLNGEDEWCVNGNHSDFTSGVLEMHEGEKMALCLSGPGGVSQISRDDELGFTLHDLKYARTIGDEADHILVGNAGNQEHILRSKGVAVRVGAATGSLVLSKDRSGSSKGKPSLESRHTAVDIPGTVTSIEHFAEGAEVEFLTQRQTQGQRPPVTNGQRPGQKPIVIDRTKPPIDLQLSTVVAALNVVRPHDMLHLRFEFLNLRLITGANDPRLEREDASKPAFIIVQFPPQALAEGTFVLGKPWKRPVDTLLSAPARLAFFIPASVKSILVSLEKDGGLLDWDDWSQVVAPTAISSFSGTIRVDPNWKPPISHLEGGTQLSIDEVYASVEPSFGAKVMNFLGQRQGNTTAGQIKDIGKLVDQDKPITFFKPQAKPNIFVIPLNIDPTKIVQAVPIRGRSGISPVGLYQTSIEMPAMLRLSPDENAKWCHSRIENSKPIGFNIKTGGPGKIGTVTSVNSNAIRVPLWHTRLGVARSVGRGPSIMEISDDGLTYYLRDAKGRLGPFQLKSPVFPSIRAIDAADYDSPKPYPAQTTLTPKNRHNLVDSMSMRTANAGTDSAPFITKRLMLTSLGAFIKGHWEYPGAVNVQFDVMAWKHEATLGRDQYDFLKEAGFLYPTGHPAESIKITERKFVKEDGEIVARLETKMYITVKKPTVTFNETNARALGFESIRSLTKITPPVDIPPGGYVRVAGSSKTYDFPMVGTDIDGNEIHWVQACSFILASEVAKSSFPSIAPSSISINMGGQPIAFARSDRPTDGTHFPCQIYRMGAVPNAANVLNGIPNFHPRMVSADIRIPALERFQDPGAPLAAKSVVFNTDYLASGFQNGTPEVFFDLEKSFSIGFKDTRKFGGMVNPNTKAGSISRKHGPVPKPSGSNASAKDFQAEIGSDVYASADPNFALPDVAKLLGVVSIWDLLPDNIPLGGNGELAPKFVVGKVFAQDEVGKPSTGKGDVVGAVAKLAWNPPLNDYKSILKSYTSPKAHLGVDAAYYDVFEENGKISKGQAYYIRSGVYGIAVNALGQVEIQIERIEYRAQSGKNSTFRVDIPQIKFMGALTFVQKLQWLLMRNKGFHFPEKVGDNDAEVTDLLATTEMPYEGLGIEPIFDLTDSGLTVGFSLAIPTIGVGIVTLMNISVLAEIILPWFGDCLVFRFAFCTRAHPFTCTVMGLGGGGFLGIEVTPNGLRSIEGAIEFGAAVAINFGVASGKVSIMAGFYFKYDVNAGTTLSGYVRICGEVDVLGLISASIELYLALNYNDKTNILSGDATISIKISLFCFHKTVHVSCHKEFAGGSGGPGASLQDVYASNAPGALPAPGDKPMTFTQTMNQSQYEAYCSAFGVA